MVSLTIHLRLRTQALDAKNSRKGLLRKKKIHLIKRTESDLSGDLTLFRGAMSIIGKGTTPRKVGSS